MLVYSMQYTGEIITGMSKMSIFLGTIHHEIRIWLNVLQSSMFSFSNSRVSILFIRA